jgi:hypothetical protein
MRLPALHTRILLLICAIAASACDKVVIEISAPSLPVHQKDPKPDYPVQTGSIRAFFGDYYRTFSKNIEQIQQVDSFSNAYFYGSCHDNLNQINLIRRDSEFMLEMYIIGYPLDSLPASLPVPSEYGKFTEIQFHPPGSSGWGDPDYYTMSGFYGDNLFISDKSDDILTGTFSGTLISATGATIPVTDGEFRIKIFRKYVPCSSDTIK